MSKVGILFYLKKRITDRQTSIPVYLRITTGRRRVEFSTGHRIEAGLWDPAKRRASGKSSDAQRLNAYLKKLKKKIEDVVRYLEVNREEATAQKIIDRLISKKVKQIMLVNVFEEHNRKISVLIGQEYAPATLTRYETTLKHLKDFMWSKYQVRNIPVNEIDYSFIVEFEFYLRSVRKCNNNSAMKYIKNFGKIVRICMAHGWILTNPFLNFKIRLKKVERSFLSPEELNCMALKVFTDPRLDMVRDVFLFSCYTGLAYADIARLKKTAVTTGVDGQQWIFTSRQKTGTPSHIPLLPVPVSILKKYCDHPDCQNEGPLLPILTNQKMNARLKDVAEQCRIKKLLTFHMARHTFATTVTLQNGVPIESVSKMLGHTNISTTQHYAKILDVKVGMDMATLKSKLQPDDYVQST